MNRFDRYMLLLSLSIFFGCLAISLVHFHFSSDVPQSYMYTPQEIDSPPEGLDRQYEKLPKSVLSYSGKNVSGEMVVSCYLENEYKKLIGERTQAGARLIANARIGKDKLELYKEDDGDFFVFVTGPDAFGQKESCEVAYGTKWQFTR